MNIDYNKLADYLNDKLIGENITYKYSGIHEYKCSGVITKIKSYFNNFNIYLDYTYSFYINVGEDFKISSYGIIISSGAVIAVDEKFLEKLNLHIKEFVFKEYGIVII